MSPASRVTRSGLVELAEVGGHVDRVLAQDVERDDVERPLVGGGQHDVGGRAVAVGPQPVGGGHAPAVAGDQAREAVLAGMGVRQVVADAALVVQELRR